MVFYVIVVTFLLTLLINKFTSTIMNDKNLDEIHAIIQTQFVVFCILTVM